jgi:hypothetical protein
MEDRARWQKNTKEGRPQWESRIKIPIPPPITESMYGYSQAQAASIQKSQFLDNIAKDKMADSIQTVRPDEASLFFGGDTGGMGARSKGNASVLMSSYAVLLRRERTVQNELQELLDLQSEMLLEGQQSQGLAPPSSRDDHSSRASSASASESRSRTREPKVRRPRTLRSARHGISRALHTLLTLSNGKIEELVEMYRSLADARTLAKGWIKRLKGIEEQIKKLEHENEEGKDHGNAQTNSHAIRLSNNHSSDGRISPEQTRSSARKRTIRNIEQEYNELDIEIRQAESEIHRLQRHLQTLQRRRSLLLNRITEERSKKEARVASWKNAKRELEIEIGSWLRVPPIALVENLDIVASISGHPGTAPKLDRQQGPEGGDVAHNFLTLPTKRRTLDMAYTSLDHSMTALRPIIRSIEREAQALQLGGEVWNACVKMIEGFEKELKLWMQRSGPRSKNFRKESEELLKTMQSIRETLEREEFHAQNEGWNLLVCALGAELESWQEGENVLRNLLGFTDDQPAADAKYTPKMKEKTILESTEREDKVDVNERRLKSRNFSGSQSGASLGRRRTNSSSPPASLELEGLTISSSPVKAGGDYEPAGPSFPAEALQASAIEQLKGPTRVIDRLESMGSKDSKDSPSASVYHSFDGRSVDLAQSERFTTQHDGMRDERAANEDDDEDDGPDPRLLTG